MAEFLSFEVGERAVDGQGLTGEFVAVLKRASPPSPPPPPELFARTPGTEELRAYAPVIVCTEGELCLMENFAASVKQHEDDLPLLRRAIAELRELSARSGQQPRPA